MMNRLVQWLLSKLIPYKGITLVDDSFVTINNWDKCKQDESISFYGGSDGTGRY